MAIKLIVVAVLILAGYLIGYADARDKYITAHRVYKQENKYFCPVCKKELYWDSRKGYQKFEHCHNCGAHLTHKEK